jgi:hypothetical protein
VSSVFIGIYSKNVKRKQKQTKITKTLQSLEMYNQKKDLTSDRNAQGLPGLGENKHKKKKKKF